MAKKVIGTCCICGKEGKLTFEHIPPRSAFNMFSMKLYDFWGFLSQNNTRYKSFQNGAGKYSLCASCNNLTGEWYGAAYAEFASQGMAFYNANSQGIIDVAYTIYPLRVFKQIVSCFASVNGPQWCQQNPEIKDFLLHRYERRFPANVDVRMYMQENKCSKFDAIAGIMDTATGEHFIGSEWAYPPFSYIYVCDKTYTNYAVLNELFSIMPFLNYDYDERVTLYLKIPRKPCNPTMLDFRKGVPDVGALIATRKEQS